MIKGQDGGDDILLLSFCLPGLVQVCLCRGRYLGLGGEPRILSACIDFFSSGV